MSRTEVQRLIEHRAAFKVRLGKGELLRLEELSPKEMDVVSKDFYSRVSGRNLGMDGLMQTWTSVLHDWGIMCSHPQHMRDYEGLGPSVLPVSRDEARWYHCGACGCSVINFF